MFGLFPFGDIVSYNYPYSLYKYYPDSFSLTNTSANFPKCNWKSFLFISILLFLNWITTTFALGLDIAEVDNYSLLHCSGPNFNFNSELYQNWSISSHPKWKSNE